MRRASLIISVVAHVSAAVAFSASVPWLSRDFEIPPPITVEFVKVSEVTETDKVAPKPAPKLEEKKPEAKKTPPPAPKNESAKMEAPKPKPKKPEEKKPEKTVKKEDVKDPNVLPDKKKDQEKKKEPEKTEKAEPKKDFSSVLRNLADPKETATAETDEKDMNLDEEAVSMEGQKAPLGQQLSISEKDALRRQLEKCWNVPIGARDAKDLAIEVFMVINPDRTLRDARLVDTGRYNDDPFYRAAADSALRAVRNPLCSPFELPPDKYESWKTISVTFNPEGMF